VQAYPDPIAARGLSIAIIEVSPLRCARFGRLAFSTMDEIMMAKVESHRNRWSSLVLAKRQKFSRLINQQKHGPEGLPADLT
jgi:hypothetical protein